MKVSGLRSPHDLVGGLVYFGRMLDKMRLHAAGALPPDYLPNLGQGFDGACCRFLGVEYCEVLRRVTETGGSDEDVLAWCRRCGRDPDGHDAAVWNAYMRKLGWNDEATASLERQIMESGHPREAIRTIFEFIDHDEERRNGRPPDEAGGDSGG